ncbi:MAG TPA: phosphatidate cytidylyltransferase [Gammaproteobacteria bacterium]|nr:phosphatidate cytidylyltransferase [Gammaproteobacteria bacterium]
MLAARIITGVVFGAAITGALLFAPSPVTAAVLGILWLAGVWEWGAFAKLPAAGRAGYTVLFAAAMAVGWLWLGDQGLGVLLVAALAWWLFALVLVVRYPRTFSSTFVALAGIVVLLPSWTLLVRLHGNVALGAKLAFTLLLIVWAADVGAYAFGRLLGRTKLAPAVSPGKTWEGVTGGLVTAGLAAALAAPWLELPAVRLVPLAVATALISVLGDLTQSMFKRNVGLKDSGKLLPGHGGVLDRIDSLTAAVPAFVVGLWALNLIR